MAPEEQAEIDAQELPPGREAKLLCCADQALNRLPRESGVSFTGNIPEPSGHSPVLWDGPAGAERWELVAQCGLFNLNYSGVHPPRQPRHCCHCCHCCRCPGTGHAPAARSRGSHVAERGHGDRGVPWEWGSLHGDGGPFVGLQVLSEAESSCMGPGVTLWGRRSLHSDGDTSMGLQVLSGA